MKNTNYRLLAVCIFSSTLTFAHAEKADSRKQSIVEADHVSINEIAQTRLLVGNVVLQRGTFQLNAGRAEIKDDPQGYTSSVFYADPTGPAKFRQKRDGGDIWDMGEAERIEYDDKTEVLKMFTNAKAFTMDKGVKTQSAQAPLMSYTARTQIYVLDADVTANGKNGGARPRIVIEPPRQ